MTGPRFGRIYVGAVIALAAAAITAMAVCLPFVTRPADAVAMAAFAPFIIAGEMRPIPMPRREGGEINASTMFAYAVALAAGTLPAVTVLALASLAADALRGKRWWKSAFNVAQYSLALIAAGAAVGAISSTAVFRPVPVVGWRFLPAVIVGSVVFTLGNLLITKVGIGLFADVPLIRFLGEDLGFQMLANEVMLMMSPVVVAAEQKTPALVPFLALPMLTLERSAAISVDRDHQALHDSLTGLPNRTLFRDRATQAVPRARRSGTNVAVMIIDLDRFKEVNDTLGHHMGDLLLKEVGPRLSGCLADGATVARLGGDEFGVVLSQVASAAEAEVAARQLLAALEQPFLVKGVRLDVSGSIGIALAPEHGDEVDVLLQRADVAMYIAKESHAGVTCYQVERDQHSMSRLAMVGELKR
ncbi:MAG TPA: GGDEF domain-containing protein, partial [Acidimicrobiales bacterium]|nr:GGDEF domain-containing protein [Acidimicrobiales bacterium]